MKNICTGAQLQKIVPNMSKDRAEKISDDMVNILPYYGIYNKAVLPDFIAQIAHESSGFRVRSESMNYSSKRMMQVWPSRFKTIKSTIPYVNNPKALANFVYNGRMGNRIGTDDGWENRGAGYIMTTGRDMAIKQSNYFGIGSPEKMMQMIRDEDYWAMSSAGWLFAIEKKLITYAYADDIATITNRINGGTIGLKDRTDYFKIANEVIA